jgi:hypothetical protein
MEIFFPIQHQNSHATSAQRGCAQRNSTFACKMLKFKRCHLPFGGGIVPGGSVIWRGCQSHWSLNSAPPRDTNCARKEHPYNSKNVVHQSRDSPFCIPVIPMVSCIRNSGPRAVQHTRAQKQFAIWRKRQKLPWIAMSLTTT